MNEYSLAKVQFIYLNNKFCLLLTNGTVGHREEGYLLEQIIRY